MEIVVQVAFEVPDDAVTDPAVGLDAVVQDISDRAGDAWWPHGVTCSSVRQVAHSDEERACL
jgi:hypothetical protein